MHQEQEATTAARVGAAISAVVILLVGVALLARAGPETALTEPVRDVTDDTLGTWFPQSWAVFAPEPVSAEFDLLAQARCEPGGEPTTFTDLSEDAVDNLRSRRWMPAKRQTVLTQSVLGLGGGAFTLAQVRPALVHFVADSGEARCDGTPAEVRAVVVHTPLGPTGVPPLGPGARTTVWDSGWVDL